MGVPFPRGLFWADAEQAPEFVDDNRYVGCLLFELLVSVQVICFYFYVFVLSTWMVVDLMFLFVLSGDMASLF